MKKTINLLIILLCLNLLILSNLLLIRYNNKLSIVPTSYAKTSIDNNDNYNLIVRILKDANKNNFIKYAEYININFLPNIPNDSSNKVAFILSLPQQVSFIAVYDQIDTENLKFSFIIDNLSSVDKFYFYKNFLVIEQHDIASSIDFEERNYIEIFYNKNGSYKSVFNKNTYYSKTIKEDSDPNNLQYIENASIDFLDGDSHRILCVTTTTIKKEKLSLLNTPKEYTDIKKDTKKEIYEWNSEKEIFEISELNYTKKELE